MDIDFYIIPQTFFQLQLFHLGIYKLHPSACVPWKLQQLWQNVAVTLLIFVNKTHTNHQMA